MTARNVKAGIALLAVAWIACAAPEGGPAGSCAEVVRSYLGLPSPVSVVGQPVETSEGRVEISYEGMNAENIPVTGSAVCTFAVGDAGELSLVEAFVDDQLLSEGALSAARRDLAEGP